MRATVILTPDQAPDYLGYTQILHDEGVEPPEPEATDLQSAPLPITGYSCKKSGGGFAC